MTDVGTRRPVVRPAPGSSSGRVGGPAEVRDRLSSPTYSAADRAVLTAVRAKLADGTFNRSPGVKKQVETLLKIIEKTNSGGPNTRPSQGTIREVNDIITTLLRQRMSDVSRAGRVEPRPGRVGRPDVRVAPSRDTGSPAELKEVTASWDHDGSGPPAGFRLYLDGEAVGDFTPGTVRRGIRELEMSEGRHVFTLTAYNADGESDHSAPAVYNMTFDDD